jgi:hypothetical protein
VSKFTSIQFDSKIKPLPPLAQAPAVGATLAEGLRQALSQEGSMFALSRTRSGEFWANIEKAGFASFSNQRGDLVSMIGKTLLRPISDQEAQAAGIPTDPAQTAVAGELLLRLFAEQERLRIWFRFDFRGHLAPHLRYRLIFSPSDRYNHYLRGSSLEELLLAGLAFLASDPEVA